MGQPNKHWDRWILASVSEHFDAEVVVKESIKMFVEGQFRDTNVDKEFFELRIDGPFTRETQKNQWRLVVEINCLVTTTMTDKDFHRPRKHVGSVSTGFHHCIKVFKFGDGLDDDQTLLGVLHLRGPTDDRVLTTHFGQIDPQSEIHQTTIEGHYEMELST